MGRKVARESTMQLLYQMDLKNDYSKDVIDIFFENNEFEPDEIKYINKVTKGVSENIENIDSFVEKYSEGWAIKRIAKIDLAILRIAIFEMLYIEGMPPQVSINEAVDIAKKYGTDQSSNYINGLLGTFLKKQSDESDKDNKTN